MDGNKKRVIADNRENKSLPLMEPWYDLILTQLPVGDYAYKNYVIEVKIGKDWEDRERMQDELSRMALRQKEFPHIEYHLVCCDEPTYHIDMVMYKYIVSECCKAGVFPHHSISPEMMVIKIDEIFNGSYEFVPKIKHAARNLTLFAKMVCQIHGVSEQKALLLSEMNGLKGDDMPTYNSPKWDLSLETVFRTARGRQHKVIAEIRRVFHA